MKTKLETKQLCVWFGKKQVLNDINLKFYKDRITAIIGPSGCGKTTLIRCLNRMNDLIEDCRVEGEVLLDGENIYADGYDVIKLRRRVGMVFQRPNPFPVSIYDNVAYGPRIHGISDKGTLDQIVESSLKAAWLWDEVKDELRRSALKLSGGQQQRLCIARALATKPEVLLFDEPCASLDPTATARIEDLLLELKQKYTIVIVTHNMQQAARISDFTAFICMGKLVEFGETEQVFENPKEELTEAYISGRFG